MTRFTKISRDKWPENNPDHVTSYLNVQQFNDSKSFVWRASKFPFNQNFENFIPQLSPELCMRNAKFAIFHLTMLHTMSIALYKDWKHAHPTLLPKQHQEIYWVRAGLMMITTWHIGFWSNMHTYESYMRVGCYMNIRQFSFLSRCRFPNEKTCLYNLWKLEWSEVIRFDMHHDLQNTHCRYGAHTHTSALHCTELISLSKEIKIENTASGGNIGRMCCKSIT